MKDKKDKADRLLDELSKELAERARSRERLSLFQDSDNTFIPLKDRLSRIEGSELLGASAPKDQKGRVNTESSESNPGCAIIAFLLWTAWTIYAVWPVVTTFTETGYEVIIKLVWILIAWGAPIVLFFSLGKSE